jgi:nucleoporin p58/p45
VIENADMAQRTHETPSGLQFENVLPQIYFKELIQRYETDLLNLKHQVELTEKHLQSLANPQNFSAQDLKRGLQQTHECFIALAGRVQDAHTKVEKQKEDYLQLRKFILRDSSNVFAAVDQEQTSSTSINRVQYGPNVFSLQGGFNIQKPQQLPQTQSQAFNIGGAGNSSLFGTTNFGFNK